MPDYAELDNLSVVYSSDDEVLYIKIGGTLPWRNNNPGNIQVLGKSNFAFNNGAIGVNRSIGLDGSVRYFAIFPDYETGKKALKKLLNNNDYKNLTIPYAINKYAPIQDGNNTIGYIKDVENISKLPMDKKIKDLSESEMEILIEAIAKREGYYGNTNTRKTTDKNGKLVKSYWVISGGQCGMCAGMAGESTTEPLDGPPYHPNCGCGIEEIKIDSE